MAAVLWIIGVSFLFYPLILGFMGIEDFELSIEIKDFSSPYYMIGVFFVEHRLEDPKYIEQEFTISLYVITLVFRFYKKEA